MKILILHKWLVMGGIERILINYLHLLKDEPNLSIDLLIAFDTPNSFFSAEIPNKNNIHYIFDKDHYIKQQYLANNKHKNLTLRLKQKWHRYKEKKYCRKKLNHIINAYDLVINFSNHFDPFINFKSCNKPILRWQHLALKDKDDKECIKEISYLKKYSKVISICDEMIKDIEHKTQISPSKLTYIYNPLNFEYISSLSKKDGIDIEKPYLIQVARLDKIKRHSDLIDIYAELVKKGVQHNLYILGDGPEYNQLKKKIVELQLEKRCYLLGEVNNPYPYIKNADLFLHTSEREGLPTVLLESAILDTIIVAMNCPTGPKEILNDGKCGELITLGNKLEFIETTHILLKDPSLQEKYKKEMKKHLQLFSEENIKKKFIELINSIIAESR